LNILYEDEWIIAANKQAGLPVQPDKTNDISLFDNIEKHLSYKPFLINRIDRPVSGIVIFAKTKESAKQFSEVIQNEETLKTYFAVTENKLETEKGTLEDYLIKKNNKAYIAKSKKFGKKAILNFEFSGKSINYYYYKITIKTGRFHQIRAQLSNQSCYIKGDIKYGAKRSNKDRSICLHAFSISFHHPFIKKQVDIKADFPDNSIWNGLIIKNSF
jgi:23S rRNA pseudouridine1911/1915/1917 synthase